MREWVNRLAEAGELLIGVPPAVFMAAGTHLPAGVDEYALDAVRLEDYLTRDSGG